MRLQADIGDPASCGSPGLEANQYGNHIDDKTMASERKQQQQQPLLSRFRWGIYLTASIQRRPAWHSFGSVAKV